VSSKIHLPNRYMYIHAIKDPRYDPGPVFTKLFRFRIKFQNE